MPKAILSALILLSLSPSLPAQDAPRKAGEIVIEPATLTLSATELKVVHDRFAGAKETYRCWSSDGAWTWILCNLKTFVETGKPMTERSFY